jgi:phosphoribosyl-ATP pyrophosphohydrolase
MDIFERNYKAVVNRGLITHKTTDQQFFNKAFEELYEVMVEMKNGNNERLNEEITDLVNTGINWLKFRNADPVEMLTKIAEKNEKRVKQ